MADYTWLDRGVQGEVDEDAKPRAPRGVPGRRTLTAKLWRKAAGTGPKGDESARAKVDRARGSGGAAIPTAIQREFELSLGASLSSVRVHTDAAAADAAASIDARAYTLGQDIYFGAGQFDADSTAGKHLLAHEVAHTVQQGGASTTLGDELEISDPGDGMEVEADRAADAMLGGAHADVSSGSGLARAVIQRAPGDGGGDAAAGGSSAAGGQGAAAAGAPTITSQTEQAAPTGPNTRFVVGIGEKVTFTGSASGAWSASGGTPASGADGDTFAWTAPGTPGVITIKLKVGDQEATKAMSVLAPSSIKHTKTSDKGYPAGQQGVGMVLDMHIGPDNVSFGAVSVAEVPSGAHSVSGYFAKAAAGGKDISHHPNAVSTDVLESNDLDVPDDAYVEGFPAPWSPGSLSWSIVHNYTLREGGGAPTPFTIVTQTMTIADNKGTSTITKGSASATRTP